MLIGLLSFGSDQNANPLLQGAPLLFLSPIPQPLLGPRVARLRVAGGDRPALGVGAADGEAQVLDPRDGDVERVTAQQRPVLEQEREDDIRILRSVNGTQR